MTERYRVDSGRPVPRSGDGIRPHRYPRTAQEAATIRRVALAAHLSWRPGQVDIAAFGTERAA